MLAAVAAALAGCGSSHPAAPKSSLPPGCSTAEADNIIADFLAHPSVAPPGFFKTVSITDPDGRHFVTHSGPAAVKYLAARIKAGENDRMISLAVAPIDFNHAAVAFRLTRYAPDYEQRHIRNRLAQGTGTLDCAHGKVAAFIVAPVN
ncbi:MAG: hypothetical protein ACXVZ4_11930 [Gaiellaceae bacterium]